jgi:predicted metal-binding membrane protein
MRAEPAVVVALIAAVGLAWWSTAERMGGMDAGPGTTLGSVGWFAGVWATMMAAMMLPSLAPAAAAFTTSVRRGRSQVLLFAAGYLTVWSAAGIGAYGLFELGGDVFAGSLAWHSGGRWLAAGVLGLAALYQVTPIKRTFLSLCRSHQHSVGEPWRDARRGALTMGMRNGGWCLGCSWALMAALFALGVMSLVWMGLIAVLVALEKIGPSERGARLATAGVMAVVTAAILLAPHDLPGFVVPDTHHDDQMMQMMG